MTSDTLEDRISALAAGLSPAERENLKLLLSMAAGGLLGGHVDGSNTQEQEHALETAQRTLPLLQKAPSRAVQDGIVFVGRAPFFSHHDLEALNNESIKYREQAGRFHDHYVASSAPVAREISLSSSIHTFLEEHVGAVIPTYKANYLYYDAPGLGIDPHVDKDEFSLNILTMLEHSGEQSSRLLLHPPGKNPVELDLKPFETLVFLADRVTHQRTRTVDNEQIRLVSFGYKLL